MRTAVALSGGVDSAVAAALLKEQGIEPVGVHMRLVDRDDGGPASAVAERLGMKFHTVDLRAELEELVVAEFCREYSEGRTPSPCIRCNELLKFGVLLERLQQFGCDRVGTGHHARVVKTDGRWCLRRGKDPGKDQSYFLYRLTQEQLDKVLLPVGEFTKDEVRSKARELGLEAAERPDSQEICFVPDDNHARFVEARCPEAFTPGPVKDAEGNVVGEHEGIPLYTVGQRKGIGIPFGERRYVIAVDARTNTVTVGPETQARARVAELEQVHWVSGKAPAGEFTALVKVRNTHLGGGATVIPAGADRAEVSFEEPQWALAPGQSAVFYEGDIVLGGGMIAASRQQ